MIKNIATALAYTGVIVGIACAILVAIPPAMYAIGWWWSFWQRVCS